MPACSFDPYGRRHEHFSAHTRRHPDRRPAGGLPITSPRTRPRRPVPADDLDDLRAIGWLGAAAPVELGGLGLNLVQLARAQRRLARFAPSTALSTCMHHYWVGLASDLRRFGLPAGTRILEWVSAGEVLASGHGEAGNDVPVSLSTARAERVTGGWRIHGRKMFGSLGPVWDRIGIHAMDTSELRRTGGRARIRPPQRTRRHGRSDVGRRACAPPRATTPSSMACSSPMPTCCASCLPVRPTTRPSAACSSGR